LASRPSLSLKARALQLLAQREHSVLELRRKLLVHARKYAAEAPEPGRRPRAAPPEVEAEIDALLAWLADGRHLSESRFVESRVRARSGRYGNLRIRQELARHGLRPSDEEDQALAASEFERARAVWSRKFGAPAEDAAGRARQARFLAGRGFSAEVVARLLRDPQD
jgi:regulatory protein